MQIGKGWITEIIAGLDGRLALRIDLPPEMIPAPGQYLLADDGAADTLGAFPLFRADTTSGAILQSSLVQPRHWLPGTALTLRGPLGHGFSLPAESSRLALVALGDTLSRLLPLLRPALDSGKAIAVFSDAALPPLPLAVEAYPLDALPKTLAWADFLALDASIAALPRLRAILGLRPHQRLACAAQALIVTPMPCGGLAACGACAVAARKGYKLACKDGPVLDLNLLMW